MVEAAGVELAAPRHPDCLVQSKINVDVYPEVNGLAIRHCGGEAPLPNSSNRLFVEPHPQPSQKYGVIHNAVFADQNTELHAAT